MTFGNDATTTKLGVLDQLAIAALPQHRLALIAGCILGGLVPAASYVMAHVEAYEHPLKWALVAAGMIYSAISVFDWSKTAFRNAVKAFGFVVLLEGVAIFASTQALSLAALFVLIAINATSTGCNLIVDRKASRAIASSMRPRSSSKKSLATKKRAPRLASGAANVAIS